jgi:hypothetical protein
MDKRTRAQFAAIDAYLYQVGVATGMYEVRPGRLIACDNPQLVARLPLQAYNAAQAAGGFKRARCAGCGAPAVTVVACSYCGGFDRDG